MFYDRRVVDQKVYVNGVVVDLDDIAVRAVQIRRGKFGIDSAIGVIIQKDNASVTIRLAGCIVRTVSVKLTVVEVICRDLFPVLRMPSSADINGIGAFKNTVGVRAVAAYAGIDSQRVSALRRTRSEKIAFFPPRGTRRRCIRRRNMRRKR